MSLRRLAPLENSTTAETAPVRTTRRRSRAKPRPPRARAVVLAELKGLGGLVHEQALLDAAALPQTSLVEWANRLAGELQVDGVGSPSSYRDLLWAIVEVNRRGREAEEAEIAEVAAEG